MSHTSRFETATMSTTSDTPGNVSQPRSHTAANSFRLRKMIDDLCRIIASLDVEISLAEDRAHVHDQSHFTYPITAKSMRTRRENLLLTITALETRLQPTTLNAA